MSRHEQQATRYDRDVLIIGVAVVAFVLGAVYGRFVVPYLVDRRHWLAAAILPSALSMVALVLTQ